MTNTIKENSHAYDKLDCECSLIFSTNRTIKILNAYIRQPLYTIDELIEKPMLNNFYYRTTYECRNKHCNNVYVTPVKSNYAGVRLTLK